MKKSRSFSFAIADTKARSEFWSIFTNGNDVYLTGSTYKRAFKISLHGSGICQIAFLEEFFANHVSEKAEDLHFRTILRWRRLSNTEGRGQVAASILFASYKFWPEKDEIPISRAYTPLNPPPDMHGRIVNVVYSRDNPHHVATTEKWTDELIFFKKLPNGEFVSLVQQVEPLPIDFFDFFPLGSQYGLTLGIDKDETNDAKGISSFDCAQLYEGHGCIRSLHNMQLVRVSSTRE